MCLSEWDYNIHPKKKSGMGYKVVRKTEKPDEFKPYYTRFSAYGGLHDLVDDHEVVYEVGDITYKLNERYEDHNDRYIKMEYETEHYHAGVHLYKTLQDMVALAFIHKDHTVIQCRYEKAMAEDHRCVCAKVITPFRVMSSQEIVDENIDHAYLDYCKCD